MDKNLTRRDLLKTTGASLAMLGLPHALASAQSATATLQEQTRDQRMQWWHAAKFGMFIHFGVYSTIGRHEWVMEDEAIPIGPYQERAATFRPAPNSPRAWARLAKQAGMKYMVMTTKHHEGFCNFDTRLTTYCAPKRGPGRDLVHEYVEAARAEGLRVGFYYSLMDWHHPDGARCADDEAARRRFVDYTHGLIRELLTNYGKIDVLWYDVSWPLDAQGWESNRMNDMVFQLQPEIIVNNRNKLEGDFATPEQKIVAETGGRAWESCMTLNDSWGYQRADTDWKSSRTIVRNLIQCARDGGNYLVEHRTQAGRLRARRIRESIDGSRPLDGHQRRNHLQIRPLPGAPFQLRQFHPHWKHSLHARPLLAGRLCSHQWSEGKSKIRSSPQDQSRSKVHPGRIPNQVHGAAAIRARLSCNHHSD